MIYHFGYARLTDVAAANELDVCPDGNEGDPAADFLVISGYVMKGRSRFTEYFKARVTPELIAAAARLTTAFLIISLSSLISPVVANVAGMPITKHTSELDMNWKNLSDDSVS